MLRGCRLLLGLLLSCTIGLLDAQGQVFQMGGPGGGSMPKYTLLFGKSVQQELKLSEEQVKKIVAKVKELTPEGSFAMPSAGKGGDDSGQPKVMMSFSFKSSDGAASPPAGVAIDPSNMRIPGMPDFKKIDEEVNKLLEQPQRDRLKQLALQRQGLSAITQEEVAKDLQLETEQKDLIKEIMTDQRKKTSEFFQDMMANGGIQQDKVAPFMKKQREQTENDLAIVLTPEQKTKWEELQGPKFEFKRP